MSTKAKTSISAKTAKTSTSAKTAKKGKSETTCNGEKKTENRSRVMRMLLYPDNAAHLAAFKEIVESGKYNYAYVLHDRDKREELEEDEPITEGGTPEEFGSSDGDSPGEYKKEHWHVVLRFANALHMSSVAKSLGLEEKFVRKGDNLDACLLYLMHYNNPDKEPYKLDEVEGPLKGRLSDLINKVEKTEGEKVSELLEWIDDQTQKIKVKDLARWCAKNGYWAEFRRAGSIFLKIVEEHNAPYIAKEEKERQETRDMLMRCSRTHRGNGGQFPEY